MLEEEEGCARGRVRLPSLSLTIYRGKGGGGGTLGFPRGGAAATGETPDGFGCPHPLGNLPPEQFRTPIPFVQYTDLHLRTIPELLVMSGISSGTPNNLR